MRKWCINIDRRAASTLFKQARQCFSSWSFLYGRAILNLLEKDIKPKDIITKRSITNALTLVMATGGSTNAVLHFLAIARAADVSLTLDDFQFISDRTPLIADLKPSGKYVMEDLHKVRLSG